MFTMALATTLTLTTGVPIALRRARSRLDPDRLTVRMEGGETLDGASLAAEVRAASGIDLWSQDVTLELLDAGGHEAPPALRVSPACSSAGLARTTRLYVLTHSGNDMVRTFTSVDVELWVEPALARAV